MSQRDVEAFARESAKHMKTDKDLRDIARMLTKVAVDTTLDGELDAQLGYEKRQKFTSTNSRNGHTTKTLKTEDGEFPLNTP